MLITNFHWRPFDKSVFDVRCSCKHVFEHLKTAPIVVCPACGEVASIYEVQAARIDDARKNKRIKERQAYMPLRDSTRRRMIYGG